MEKKLFLAIGLSLMVMWGWSVIMPAQKTHPTHLPAPQPKVSTTRPDQQSNVVTFPAVSDENPKKEEITTLMSNRLKAEFTNLGGVLNDVYIVDYAAWLPIKEIIGVTGFESTTFSEHKKSENEIEYIYEFDGIKIIKKYEIFQNEYHINTSIEVINTSNMSKDIDFAINNFTIDMSRLDNIKYKEYSTDSHDKSLFEYVIFNENGMHRKAGAHKFNLNENKEGHGKVYWSGFRSRYFCLITKPLYNSNAYTIDTENTTKLKIFTKNDSITLQPNTNLKFDFIIFVGPERSDVLSKYSYGFEKIKKYYKFGLFDGIAKIIGSMMSAIYRFIPNWGVTIIIVSTIIYFSTYPLTARSMMSMRKMQALQPMIVQMKDKYKDNPQKLNKEMMELYKEHKVNPLGGCLPMLLQMPVFIGLYQVLWRSVFFKGAGFLWIKDLSQPDRLFKFNFNLPFIGNEFNLLPILIAIVMFIQQKFTSKNMVIADPAQAAQQKMMTTIMPIFIGVIFYKFASGLTLYFTMFYIFSAFSQWKMSRMPKGA